MKKKKSYLVKLTKQYIRNIFAVIYTKV